jgi:hypothetical protein
MQTVKRFEEESGNQTQPGDVQLAEEGVGH